jgi:hypothetical protein
MAKISRSVSRPNMQEELKILGIYTWFHAYRRFYGPLCPVVLQRKMKFRLEEYRVDQATVLLPWNRQTTAFKSVWCSRVLKFRCLNTMAFTLRLGDDQIDSFWNSPYGFAHALARRLNRYLDPAHTPYWFVAELKDGDETFCPHVHGVIGLPRPEWQSPPDPFSDIELVKSILRTCAGDFDAARALKVKWLYETLGWSDYCSKQVAFTEGTMQKSAYYIPHALRRDCRALYEAHRTDLKRLLRSGELHPLSSGATLYVPAGNLAHA